MRRLVFLSVLCTCIFTHNNVFGGPFTAIRTKTNNSNSDEYIKVGSNNKVIECDDDTGDAGTKTVVYWQTSGVVYAYRCYIAPRRTDSDYWTSVSVNQCENNKCPSGRESKAFPDDENISICSPANRGIKTIGDWAIITEGSETSMAVGCYFTTCQQNDIIQEGGQCISENTAKHGATCFLQCIDNNWYNIIETCTEGFTCAEYYDDGHGCKTCKQTTTDAPSTTEAVTPPASTGTGGDSSGGGTLISCTQRRQCSSKPNAAECATCCVVPASVAKWNSATNKCECVDTTKTFDITASAAGYCVAPGTSPVTPPANTFECTAEKTAQLAKWKVKYASNTDISASINAILELCKNKTAPATIFDVMYAELVALIGQYDATQAANEAAAQAAAAEAARKQAEQDASKARITSITGKLNNLKSGLSVSVWKNKEGNFNTSRLVSDSVAGVVLGTAGGLITSNVIKKNQVKGGFEDIKCTIRGQVVADYGDDFQVGIQ